MGCGKKKFVNSLVMHMYIMFFFVIPPGSGVSGGANASLPRRHTIKTSFRSITGLLRAIGSVPGVGSGEEVVTRRI
jgi:hypothetical protein